jgi:hypothetical protein
MVAAAEQWVQDGVRTQTVNRVHPLTLMDETALQRCVAVGFCTSGPLSFWSRAPIIVWS